MKKITARFHSVDFAQYAANALESKIPDIKLHITAHTKVTSTHASHYPIKPDYIGHSNTNYIDGRPPILSSGPIYHRYYEPAEKKGAKLSVYVPDSKRQNAVSILLSLGGLNIKEDL